MKLCVCVCVCELSWTTEGARVVASWDISELWRWKFGFHSNRGFYIPT